MRKTLNGRLSVACSKWRTPARPSTFAISWGGAITAVVPRGRTARVNSDGESRELSM